MNADGVAVLRGGELLLDGGHPPETAICALPRWVGALGDDPVYPTDRLSMINSSAEAYKQVALMSVLSTTTQVNRARFYRVIFSVSALNVDGRKHGRRLIWLLSAGLFRMTKVRRGASSV
jgi:hypothetical protein